MRIRARHEKDAVGDDPDLALGDDEHLDAIVTLAEQDLAGFELAQLAAGQRVWLVLARHPRWDNGAGALRLAAGLETRALLRDTLVEPGAEAQLWEVGDERR